MLTGSSSPSRAHRSGAGLKRVVLCRCAARARGGWRGWRRGRPGAKRPARAASPSASSRMTDDRVSRDSAMASAMRSSMLAVTGGGHLGQVAPGPFAEGQELASVGVGRLRSTLGVRSAWGIVLVDERHLALCCQPGDGPPPLLRRLGGDDDHLVTVSADEDHLLAELVRAPSSAPLGRR